MSNMILFGAGASWGSDAQCTPPLGSALFDALRASSPDAWGRVSETEVARFKTDFEQGMKEYAESHSSDGTVDKLQRAMAAYFFQFTPEREENLYRGLAYRIKQTAWRGSLATLNYERLLELSLRKEGVEPAIDGGTNGDIQLCLPHGCCHLFINMQMRGPILLGSMNVKMDSQSPPVAINDRSKFQERITGDQLPPVMCYFQPDKEVRSGPSFIETQRRQFDDLVKKASVIGIIGVKVRPHDTHIWGPLAGTSAKLVYCAGKDAAPEFDTWSRDAQRTRDYAFSTYWEDVFDDICEEVGINVVS